MRKRRPSAPPQKPVRLRRKARPMLDEGDEDQRDEAVDAGGGEKSEAQK